MKRLALASLALFVAMAACSPFAAPLSAADSQATSIALAGTQAALTMAAQPTRKPTRTPQATPTLLAAPSETATGASTESATPDGAASATHTVTVTGSGPSATPSSTSTSTATATATFSGTVTATFTFTPGVLLHGTVPPDVPYGYVTLRNLSNEMAYIAFRCVIEGGLTSLLEYPVYGTHKIKLPVGQCHWTAFVKGQEFSGDVHIKKFVEYTFTFKPKKVTFTQP